ncbi:hypothetical protein M0R45_035424 [Rubus argutus]|uniref:NADH dehydrogenase subunit 6 n=1 Tax=Rubus argutus TaxID=59490 RepID=A0AAW1VW01_RUBAR
MGSGREAQRWFGLGPILAGHGRKQGAVTLMREDSHGWATGSVQLDWVIHGQRELGVASGDARADAMFGIGFCGAAAFFFFSSLFSSLFVFFLWSGHGDFVVKFVVLQARGYGCLG